ncbi:MAG: hypothetical protein ACK4UN_17435, partial [Limisphaerales bacterium]
ETFWIVPHLRRLFSTLESSSPASQASPRDPQGASRYYTGEFYCRLHNLSSGAQKKGRAGRPVYIQTRGQTAEPSSILAGER